jgi:diguanylate cyclase (GGDEF)-like protein
VRRFGEAVRKIVRVQPGSSIGGTPNAGVVRVMTLLAGVAALIIAVIVPVSWFLAARAGLRGEVEIHVHTFVNQVEDEARQNPAFWNALADSEAKGALDDLSIARPPGEDERNPVPERRRVFSGKGRVLIDVTTPIQPPWPVLAARLAVRDSTTRLGEVEVSRSLRPALMASAVVAFGSSTLGVLMFVLLRVAPLRMLDAAIAQASFLFAHDQLTGLPNRRLFHDRLDQALLKAERDGRRIALFYMDLDHFKIINDLLGHPAGDATLRTVAVRLRSCLRASDTLARLGGDEFAVILSDFQRVEDADRLGKRLIAVTEAPIQLDGQFRQVGLSVGIAVSPAGVAHGSEQLMKQADMALYQAKGEGRGCVRFFTPEMNQKLRARHAMETDLRSALSDGTLTLHYQPQVDLLTRRVCGAEALLRWNRPNHGLVHPGKFIAMAEDTGLIVPIGEWVLHEACKRAAAWPEPIGIAVNVSALQLRQPGFPRLVVSALQETGLAPCRLELEVTESVLMRDTEEMLATFQRLRDLGVRLAMDDFGTGYSSLGYLQRFQFDKIKIDQSFVSRLGTDPNAAAIMRAVIGMTEALGIRANAEGVETHVQAAAVLATGCAEAQGYLYGRPLPGDVFDALVCGGQTSGAVTH